MKYSIYSAYSMNVGNNTETPEGHKRVSLVEDGKTTVWFLPKSESLKSFKSWLSTLDSMDGMQISGKKREIQCKTGLLK